MAVKAIESPGLVNLATECPRALASAAFCDNHKVNQYVPDGNGEVVWLLPGYLTDDLTMASLSNFLTEKNYATKKWKGGTHLGPSDHNLEHAVSRLVHIFNKHEKPVNIIGWSLGGILGREIARIHPEMVSQVITLGSPHLAGIYSKSSFLETPLRLSTHFHQAQGNIKKATCNTLKYAFHQMDPRNSLADKFTMAVVYPGIFAQTLLKQPDAMKEDQYAIQMAEPINVPCTHVYSKNDGIVPWQACLGEPNKTTQNLQVMTSHLGMGCDNETRLIIADRLYQNGERNKESWVPFDAAKYRSSNILNPFVH